MGSFEAGGPLALFLPERDISGEASRFSLSDENDAAGDGESDVARRGVRLGPTRLEGRSSCCSTDGERFAKRAILRSVENS